MTRTENIPSLAFSVVAFAPQIGMWWHGQMIDGRPEFKLRRNCSVTYWPGWASLWVHYCF